MPASELRAVIDVELPIVQAPMAGVQSAEMAIAVCNAGGLGSLPAAMLSLEDLRAGLRLLSGSTSGLYNVNFFCHEDPPRDPAREQAWLDALRPYYEELGLAIEERPAAPSRRPFSRDALDVLAEFGPPVLSFHFGLPAPDLLTAVKSWGARVLSTATTVDEARWLEAHGVDAIIAQGLEAGGHRGHFLSDDLTTHQRTLALVTQVVDAVRVPVIAAGGIADADGVAAAIATGAAAVQVGTAYLLCPEATTTQVHRAALRSPAVAHTALTNVFTGRPARGIVNRLMRELGPMSATAPVFPLAAAALAPLRARAEAHGSNDFSPLWCGENAAACAEVSAADLTRSLAQGCR